MEILMVTGLLAYIMNYIIGKNKNSRLAQAWFSSHRELLESNFALVGESPLPFCWTTAGWVSGSQDRPGDHLLWVLSVADPDQ